MSESTSAASAAVTNRSLAESDPELAAVLTGELGRTLNPNVEQPPSMSAGIISAVGRICQQRLAFQRIEIEWPAPVAHRPLAAGRVARKTPPAATNTTTIPTMIQMRFFFMINPLPNSSPDTTKQAKASLLLASWRFANENLLALL